MNHHQQQQQQQSQQNMQMGSGLTRYRSAPSSYFTSFLNSNTSGGGFEADDFDHLFDPRASSPETQRIFTRYMNNADGIQENFSSNMTVQSQSQSQINSQFSPPKKNEHEALQPQQMMYQSHNSKAANSATDSSYNGLLGSISSNPAAQMKMEYGGGNSSLIRQRSSPAGLFANINVENEFGSMRGVGMMAPISETGSKGIGETSRQFDEDRGNDDDYIPGFPINSWDDSAILSDNFLKGLAENDDKTSVNANALDIQNNEGGNRPKTMLSHHLSLPTSSSELSAMEKLLQDSVPCKTRAKRGFATHPRSIAERVRRTKISERMRKLQELVPNMEKQTNTADMLDLAVDYIKDLQRQVKMLSDNRANCSCSAKQKS